MQSIDIRSKFFAFFASKNHTQVESSSLIPAQDPTILFTNAGMNQFKDLFLGYEKRSYARAVTIQKCVRAGGKHNDLDNVGFTKRHLTFFEMMGNFAFDDYFKKEAIVYGWEFLTEHIGLPKDKLYVTVFETDDEAFDIWHRVVGVPKEKIFRLGADTNFWAMGDVGPCGPCTEIFIDRGVSYGGPDESPATNSERFLEIWNLVFMQYDRQIDGALKPLKATGVDTGMGLERLALITQDADSVYGTDLFIPIIRQIELLCEQSYEQQTQELKAAFHVLADHIRSTTFLITAGCTPSNEGRGYVLRKIIRRAALFAQKLTQKNIFPELCHVVVKQYGSVYKELVEYEKTVAATLHNEVEKFSVNLVNGMSLLNELFVQQATHKAISGADAFKLYDTYGFPFEITVAAALQKGFTVDEQGFQAAMEAQKNKSGNKTVDLLTHLDLPEDITTTFTGYDELNTTSLITALVCNNELVQQVNAGSDCFVITQKSPFFIVGGGQVPDNGWLVVQGHMVPIKQVRYIKQAIGALINTPIDLTVGLEVESRVNAPLRIQAMKNHTATHLLQAALIERFGPQIKQAGSLVHPDYLRFDFSFNGALSADDISAVEDIVNQKIMENVKVDVAYMSLKEATAKGALAFFGDKYKPEKVRVIDVPDFSIELCGGTHVHATGDIGVFKITEVTSLAAGQKRIVAVTGPGALKLFQSAYHTVKKISVEYKVKVADVETALERQKVEKKQADVELKKVQQQLLVRMVDEWLTHAKMVNRISVCTVHVKEVSTGQLLEIGQLCLQKAKGLFIIVNKTNDSAVTFVVTVSSDCASQVSLGSIADRLKEKGFKCGVQKLSLQGGGLFTDNFDIESYIINSIDR